MKPIGYIQLTASILLICLFSACQTTIPLDLGDNTPRIVINSIATTQKGISISISESLPTGIATPKVRVYYVYDHPNCPYKTILHVNDRLVPINEIAHYQPQTGDHIAISVEKDGLKTASAITTVPAQPSVGNLSVKKLDITHRGRYASNALDVNLEAEQYLEIEDYKLSIPIQGATKDTYYRIIVEKQPVLPGKALRNEPYLWYQEQLDDPLLAQFTNGDVIFESGTPYPMNLLAGSNLPASDYTLTTTLSFASKVVNKDGSIDQKKTSQEISDYIALRVTVYAITADLYHYWQTSTSARYNQMSSLGMSEPILIYNNIQDGFGILGSMTASKELSYRIDIDK